MQMLLNIPDKYVSLDKSFQEMILEMDADGVRGIATILPKGHDIIDGTELNKYLDDLIYAEQKVRLDGYETRTDIIERIKIKAGFLTIIEADKDNREKPNQTLKTCKNCGYPYKLAGKCYSCDNYSQWIPIEADKGD